MNVPRVLEKRQDDLGLQRSLKFILNHSRQLSVLSTKWAGVLPTIALTSTTVQLLILSFVMPPQLVSDCVEEYKSDK